MSVSGGMTANYSVSPITKLKVLDRINARVSVFPYFRSFTRRFQGNSLMLTYRFLNFERRGGVGISFGYKVWDVGVGIC